MKQRFMDRLEVVLCPIIGCTSVFARWWSWPYMRVCHPLAVRNCLEELQ